MKRRLLWLFQTKARRRRAFIAAIVLVWLIDQRGQPIWVRPDAVPIWRVNERWIHQTEQGLVLRDDPKGSIRCARHHRELVSIDDRFAGTQVHVFRRLIVKVNDRWLDGAELESWRWPLAMHCGSACIALPDIDRPRTIWLGYPADWFTILGVLLQLAAVPMIPVGAVIILRRLPSGPPRESRHAKALRRGLCPECGYDILHLPQPRCPECGETWLRSEERPPADQTVGP